ncbi:MAG: metallophosphoesterase, partial [Propionibacteriaceae bacterium]|nr:metallophosphoesterase [Propionibacteriaceae bacterium]
DHGTLGHASLSGGTGLSRVLRFYNSSTADFWWAATDTEIAQAKAAGYTQQDIATFYAPTSPSSCTVAVHRLTRNKHTRNAWTETDLAGLTAAGWTDTGTSFYLKPVQATAAPTVAATSPSATPSASTSATPTVQPTPSTSTTPTPTPTPTSGNSVASSSTFGLAVIPDTQNESSITSNKPLLDRANWLVTNKDAFELRYVLHTGDMVNWGWLDTAQLTRARAAMDVIGAAGIPYDLSIGNHDTAAVGWNGISGSTGYGGSAYVGNPECVTRLGESACNTSLLVRNTEAFNATFPVGGLRNLGGTFEAGKIDNNWTTFTANGTKWLVLTLEFAPRKTAVEWARKVVADHPEHNVIIQTHYYLESSGSISTSNAGYGETSGKYIYDQIVSKYANVKLVFSGHTGSFTSRTDTINGNTVVSYLGNDLGDASNDPVRLLTINTDTGKVTSTVYNPLKNATAGTTSNTITVIG